MPERETLERLGAIGATLAIHLSIANLGRIIHALTPVYGADCPVVVAYRVSWPDELLLQGTLGTIRDKVKEARIVRGALVLVGPVLGDQSAPESRLYAADHHHLLRPRAI
jgi:precorrin-4/cobalt-precorrin-4 C11-methyltransferase